MQVIRKVEDRNGLMALSVRALFDDQEVALIRRFGLLRYRIKTSDGPFVGRDALPTNLKLAYRAQLGKIKNRWSAALVRTTSFILLDVLLLLASLVFALIKGLIKLVFGRRKTLSAAIKGITITSRRIERIKEAEFFIFVSLAAVGKALRYLGELDLERVYQDDQFLAEIEGLDFAGAGNQIESDFAGAEVLLEQASKA